jgi:hypothetical protein
LPKPRGDANLSPLVFEFVKPGNELLGLAHDVYDCNVSVRIRGVKLRGFSVRSDVRVEAEPSCLNSISTLETTEATVTG